MTTSAPLHDGWMYFSIDPTCIFNSNFQHVKELLFISELKAGSEGFEPPDHLAAASGFQDRCNQPDSANSPYQRTKFYINNIESFSINSKSL